MKVLIKSLDYLESEAELFVGTLKATDEKSEIRIQISNPVVIFTFASWIGY